MSIDPTEIPPEIRAEQDAMQARADAAVAALAPELNRLRAEVEKREAAEAHTRRAWAAALEWASYANHTCDDCRDDLRQQVRRIERGDLAPWRCGAHVPLLGPQAACVLPAHHGGDHCNTFGGLAPSPGQVGTDTPAAPASPETAAQPNPGTVAPPERQSAAEAVIEAAWDDARDDADLSALSATTRPLPPPRLDATRPADIPALVAMPDLTDRERADFLAAAAELDGEPAPLDLDAIEARVNGCQTGFDCCAAHESARQLRADRDRLAGEVADTAMTLWHLEPADAPADATLHERVTALHRRLVTITARVEADRDAARAELAELRASLADRDRRTAAAALDAACGWLPKTCPQIVKKALAMFAREVRAGTRTIPTTTEEPS